MIELGCPCDAVCPGGPVCQYCGRECDTYEYVWTGDNESYDGYELWCWCEDCQTDTFHVLVKDENSPFDKFGNPK